MAELAGALILESIGGSAILGTELTAGGWVTTTAAGAGLFTFSATAASLVGGAALFAGSVALAYATAPGVPKPSDGAIPLRQATPPRLFGYGRTRIAGSYMLFQIDTVTWNSWDVLALHHGPIIGNFLYYLDDDLVSLSAGAAVNGLGNGPGSAYFAVANSVIIKTTLGPAANTAFADVIATLPAFWTSTHRGDGIATLQLKCIEAGLTAAQFTNVFPRGLPKPSVVADLAPVWDHRDGAQVRATPSTWLVSSNPVVQLIDYLTQGYGPGISYTNAISPVQSAWDTEAGYCDDLITLNDTSTEKRYRSNGWALMTTDPAEVIGAILQTCDGWLCEKGDGTLALIVGKYRSPTVTFTDDHIVGFTLDKGVPDHELINQINFTYTPPANNFKEAPGNPWIDSTSVSLLGKTRATSMNLHWVQSHTQARRIVKRAMMRHQAVARGTLTTTLYGLKGLGERWINVTSSTITDLASAVIEVMPHPRVDLAAGRVTFNYIVIDPSLIDAWTPSSEEGLKPNFAPMPGTVNGSTLTIADNGGGTHKIKVTFSDPKQNWLGYYVDYKTGAGAWARQTFNPLQVPVGANIVLLTTAITPATYSVRVAAVSPQDATGLTAFGIEPGNWAPTAAGTSVVIA